MIELLALGSAVFYGSADFYGGLTVWGRDPDCPALVSRVWWFPRTNILRLSIVPCKDCTFRPNDIPRKSPLQKLFSLRQRRVWQDHLQ